MKKIMFYAVVLTACFASCNREEVFTEESDEVLVLPEKKLQVNEIYSADAAVSLLRPFGKALYNAMNESPMLREMIKTKALEMFNKDYDVLYQFIKNEPVENGLTMRQLLLKYVESEESLIEIELRHPTLTIFVPQLPENSFSAELWNTAEQVPAVAIQTKHGHTPVISRYGFFDENSDEFVIEAGLIPAFPIVVIKDNKWVVVAQSSRTKYAALDNKNSDVAFDFIDDFFDGSKKEPEVTPRSWVLTPTVDSKVVEAYNIYQSGDGWQRDYVYYDLAPSTLTKKNPLIIDGEIVGGIFSTEPVGLLSRDFREVITSFRFSGNHTPALMLWYITNSSEDPTLLPFVANNSPDVWTSGNYSFKIFAEVATKETLIPSITQYFLASPKDLFEVSYKPVSYMISGIEVILAYSPEVTGFKTKNLDLEFMTWDLASYATEMKISITKQNLSQQITASTTSKAEFAGNIGLDLTTQPPDAKFGLKFGLSGKIEHENTVTKVTQIEDKELGDVIIHFGDKVVLSQSQVSLLGIVLPVCQLREYHSGMYSITFVPTRVQ